MANIGTFTTTKNGFTGQIKTLALNVKAEALALKECLADLTLENRLLKKGMIGVGEVEELDRHQKGGR